MEEVERRVTVGAKFAVGEVPLQGTIDGLRPRDGVADHRRTAADRQPLLQEFAEREVRAILLWNRTGHPFDACSLRRAWGDTGNRRCAGYAVLHPREAGVWGGGNLCEQV